MAALKKFFVICFVLLMIIIPVHSLGCGPYFPASFIDSEDAKISQFSEKELIYHLSLLQTKFFDDCIPPSPKSQEKDPVEEREEYRLYSLGIKEITDNPKCSFPLAWKKLLNLPPNERRYRTIRTYYMLGNLAVRNDRDYPAAYEFYQKLRAEAIAGFPDNLGLSMDSIKSQVRYFESIPWLCKALAIQARYGIIKESLSSKFKVLKERINKNRQIRKEMLEDPFLSEMLLLIDPTEVVGCNQRFLLADRLAMRAFQAGNFLLAKQLLDQSPDYSLIKLYLQARFARRNGDYQGAAEYLRKWLKLYDKSVGFEPPEVKFLRSDSEGYTPYLWRQEIHGVLGLVAIEAKDFQEALLGFACADSWHDAALIAEQYLSTDELKKFVNANDKFNSIIPENISNKLRHLLARRLLRENRFAEVKYFDFPSPYEMSVKEYLHCRIKAQDLSQSVENRAQNWFRCGQILLNYNIELLGYELSPDFHIVAGCFPCYPPFRMVKENKLPRFHYRKTITDCFDNSAKLTKDKDLRFLAYLISGWLLKDRTPEQADYYYKSIVAMNKYPLSKVFDELRWFPKAPRKWKERVYNEINPFTPKSIIYFLKSLDF